MSDAVNHPPHYGGAANVYEVIKVIEAHALDFCLGNAVKYILRAGKKGERVEDLRKARWYLDREIQGPPASVTAAELNDVERGLLALETRVKSQSDLLDTNVRAVAGHGDMLEAMADEVAKLHALVMGMADRIAAQSESLSRAAEKPEEALGPQHFVPHESEARPAPIVSEVVQRQAMAEYEAETARELEAPAGDRAAHPQTERARPRRLAIARYLAANGPAAPADIFHTLGIPKGSITGLLACDLFTRVAADGGQGVQYALTDSGRAALAADGYVLIPATAEPKPAPEETKAPEPETILPEVETPEPEPAKSEPLTDAERKREQVRLIAEALAAHGKPMLVDEIAKAAGLPVDLVTKWLNKCGPQNPGTRYFCKSARDWNAWCLTNSGTALVAKEGAQQA